MRINTNVPRSKPILVSRALRACAPVILLVALALLIAGYADIESSTPSGSSSDTVRYDAVINVSCKVNVLLSRYNAQISVDEDTLGIVDHGASKTFHVKLTAGKHKVVFAREDDSTVDGTATITAPDTQESSYVIECKTDRIEVSDDSEATKEESAQTVSDDSQADSPDAEGAEQDSSSSQTGADSLDSITIQNDPAFAEILQLGDYLDPKIGQFVAANKGRTVEFDGHVANSQPHEGYTTRFGVLISAGNAETQDAKGPAFQFQTVNWSDMHTDLDTVSMGTNVHVKATIESYDEGSSLLLLRPVALTGRQANAAQMAKGGPYALPWPSSGAATPTSVCSPARQRGISSAGHHLNP